VALSGDLTVETVPALLRQADSLVAAGELDLAQVGNADSAGVAFLLELARRAQRAGKPLTIHGASEQLRRLIRFFELDSALTLSDSGTR
jgi:anti-anti-sigma factor